MTILFAILTQVLHGLLVLLAAPLVTGIIATVTARLTGRAGPPLLLPWRDLVRLSRKSSVTQENLSLVAQIAPTAALGTTITAALLVPSFTVGMALSPLADVLVIAGLLSIGRVAANLGALDAGAAVPGLAAQNSSALAVITEPALILSLFALALMGGNLNLDVIIAQQQQGMLLPGAASAVAATGLLALLHADGQAASVGLDDIQNGIDLALIRLTGWLRQIIWFDLIGALFLPIGMARSDAGPLDWLIGLALWLLKTTAFIGGVAAIQAWIGRLPSTALSDLIGIAALLAMLATVIALASTSIV